MLSEKKNQAAAMYCSQSISERLRSEGNFLEQLLDIPLSYVYVFTNSFVNVRLE